MKKLVAGCMVALLLSLALVGCSGAGGGAADTGAAGAAGGGGESSAGKMVEVTSMTIDGVEFTLGELDLHPMFSPGNMPEGNVAFSVKLNYVGDDAAVETALKKLYNAGTLLADDESCPVGATSIAVDGGFVYLMSSHSPNVDSETMSLQLCYENEYMVLR